MAPPPEYDKEPKAPDKSVTSSTSEDPKLPHTPHDQQTNSDNKPANAAANVETEDSKHVEALDDGQLRALLDEAITYKCPKDREGKSSLFKELLEGVEQEEQACEAAARTWGASSVNRARGVRSGGGRSRRALPHSNSLQDLVAALAAEPVPRRRHHPHHPPPQVSARTHHGGSLPSGVDTSFLLGEDSGRSSMPRSGGVEYVATVHCENPSPLTERRVSASDAPGAENEPNRRSKVGAFPMTYTARATLEIGSGSVGAGRAVTTTTASNQVRTPPAAPDPHTETHELYAETPEPIPSEKQLKLLSALCPKGRGGGADRSLPRGPDEVRVTKRKKNKKKVAEDLPFYSPGDVEKSVALEASSKNIKSKQITILKRECSDQQKKRDERKITNEVAQSSSSRAVEPKSGSLPTQQSLTRRPQTKTKMKKPNEETKFISPGDVASKTEPQNVDLLRRATSKSPRRTTDSKKSKEIAGALPFNTLFPSYYNTSNPYLRSCLANIATAHVSTTEIPKAPNKIDCKPLISQEPKITNVASAPAPQTPKPPNKKKAAQPVTKITNSAPTEQKPANKNKGETLPSREPKLPAKKKAAEKAALKPANNTREESNCQPKTLDIPLKLKEDAGSMPFKALFPNFYNNPYLNPINTNLDEAQPTLSNRHDYEAPILRSYNSVDYNYTEPQTDGPTRGPPEALFQKGIPKSRKPSHNNNNFLRQYYTNNAYKTNPIICPQNSDESYSYAAEPFGEGPTYSSQCRNRERNNNITEANKTKPDKRHPGKPKHEKTTTKSEMSKTVVENNRSPIRNVRPMTIAKRVTDVLTRDDVSVTDNRTIDKNNDRNCKRRSGISDSAVVDTNTRIDNGRTQLKDGTSTQKANKDNPEMKEKVATMKEKTFKEKKKALLSKEKIISKKVKFDCPKDEIGDSTKTEVNRNVIKSNSKEKSQEKTQIIAKNPSNKSTSIEEDDDKSDEMKPTRSRIKTLLFGVDGSIELVDMTHRTLTEKVDKQITNSEYFTEQEKFFQALETSEPNANTCDSNEQSSNCDKVQAPNESSNDSTETHSKPYKGTSEIQVDNLDTDVHIQSKALKVIDVNTSKSAERGYSEQYVLAELSNNACVYLTDQKRLLNSFQSASLIQKLQEFTSGDAEVSIPEKKDKKKRNKAQTEESRVENPATNLCSDKAVLRKVLFEKLLRDGVAESRLMSPGASKKVDSGIPFSCITTPEVVASCNTTASSPQAAAALDTKPRSSASAGFNGLPLSRPNYGATGSVDEYKKSLDENGNSVQGFSSPLAGSSHNKKPRRKKSSKNETVIKSHQIDGYQGNKDLNEVLRFIESNEEQGKKLGRVHPKHKDDADDKGKKRSSERRKDKERATRASSLEERSRTTIAELTGRPKKEPAAPARPRAPRAAARRSWGDDARHDYYYEASTDLPPPSPPPAPAPAPPPAPAPALIPAKPEKKRSKPAKTDASPTLELHSDTALELMDFQTVTKKKKQRKRFDDNGGGNNDLSYRKPRLNSPDRRRKSAPPSDKSNDSNDDMDSVHSLPADAGHAPAARGPAPTPTVPAPAPHVSYADIARTRHNIPDLIESCNFYADEPEPARAPAPRESAAPLAYDADSYPALEARLPRRRDKPRPAVKEPPPEPEEPPPDVVADRRPPVILLDEAARPRDMDGITFGFDINEQLLNNEAACGATRRCDLLREALDAAAPVTSQPQDGVCAAAGLRYVPPAPPPPHHAAALHKIVDYVGHAWEDIIKCGAGKVRYFSE